MAKQSRRTWQRHEEQIAKQLNVRRNGNVGSASSDVSTPFWAIECKSWAALPARVQAALQQAERAATGHQTAIAVLHQVNTRHDQDLVVLRWRDFAALLLGNNSEDRLTRARVEMADASSIERAIFTPDNGEL